MRSWRLVVVVLIFGIGVTARGQSGERVLIVDAVQLPNTSEAARQEFDRGLSSVTTSVIAAGVANCDHRECLSQVSADADRVVLLSGHPNRDDGVDLHATVWSRGSITAPESAGSCNYCVTTQIASVATSVVTQALQLARAAPPPVAAASSPPIAIAPAAPSLVGAPGPSSAGKTTKSRLVLPVAVGAAGVAALAAGITFWALDGQRASGSCHSGAGPGCSLAYDTRTTGEVLTAAGAIGIAVGALLLWRAELSPSGTQVAVGPSSFFIRGSF